MFQPTRAAAYEALHDFLPNAGSAYAESRNADHGPDRHQNVSTLSPWIRTRTITEWEVLGSVLEQHPDKAASKFIDEICWRTYWKGWLQLRPSVWDDYLHTRAQLLEAYSNNPGYVKAVSGQTGIDCFDAWAHELIETGYLHNHARMWAASIWIHTLKLPWELGADWFLRQLLDGDAASNTLSWRWVAGLHTRGKSYLATAGNIKKYTSGRFAVDVRLATEPVPVPENRPPSIRPLPDFKEPTPDGKTGLLVTEDDVSAARWLPGRFPVDAVAGFLPAPEYTKLGIGKRVVDFRRACLREQCGEDLLESMESLINWCKEKNLRTVLMAEPPVGFWSPVMQRLAAKLDQEGIARSLQRHWWDETLYPRATHGFFRFKQAIPAVIQKLGEQTRISSHA